ncbi:hypothetical protein SDRG_05887 [Saprolegnia diclina VS20]|uniref:Cyclic nucleotide-binding domain-containing protein n=1 Tax=Saprolegnia diclina (strain VS20) TaxID=1156394 RepID=T0QRA3_SAPDV|nr:hypothetical protein SDRG_05887 [Saprolegnia diclina VS20]EQC36430.1 hypothetical protein SDRG_05887 [Saprolegnia diclina VS20]|eukprot:XP_008609851.1 hypothetical protein SDRG_05887 [Saprolegnia diclina VS20]
MQAILPSLPESAPHDGSLLARKKPPQSARSILLRSKVEPRTSRSTARRGNTRPTPASNIWSHVVRVAVQKKKREPTPSDNDGDALSSASVATKELTSLATLLKSSRLRKFKGKSKARPDLEPSNAMRQWALPIHTQPTTAAQEKEDHPDISDDNDLGELARRKQDALTANHGRNLILDEACRAAFTKDAENRSHLELQSLKTWFLKTKLKTCTDFEALQPLELTLLCRRMKLATYYPNEVVFKQGDDGDALYIIFSGMILNACRICHIEKQLGSVDVRVSQKIGGEVIEVVVCELHKGDFFGERSLLRDEPRAATVVTKTMTELVSICREDYNVMLKQDQQDFIDRGKVAPAIAAAVRRVACPLHETYVRILRKKPNLRTKADVALLTTYIETIKFFRALPKAFLRELCSVIELVTVGPNTTIFREGEVGKLFYVIMTGSVDVKVNSVDRRGGKGQMKLINLSEGAHFGELALMKANGLRSATVVTTQLCELLIIAEHDYNNILRKLQKEDMSKRLELLDKIPMFQSVEWTNELLEEICYVLVEQRFPAGSTLYAQGDKAMQMYFVTRGECVLTRTVVDPKTQVAHETTIERLGPFNVVGDDAATGTNFNEVIYRADTVTATTPIDALVLTKYDVFNRLSRGARETLWSHTRAHKAAMVVMDQLYKSLKWKAYTKHVLATEVDGQKLARRLRHRPAPSLDPIAMRPKMSLLESNDLLLVTPPTSSPSSAMTLAKYTTQYNPDITTEDRDHVMALANATECAERAARAADGNPAEYLRYLHDNGETPNDAVKSIISEKDYFSEHYIFSMTTPPLTPRPPPAKKPLHAARASRANLGVPRAPVLLEFAPKIVVINVAHQQLQPVAPHPAFRLAGMFASKEAAETAANAIEEYEAKHVRNGFKAERAIGYYTIDTGKYVLVPSTLECLLSPYYCDQALHGIIDEHTDWNYWRSTRAKHCASRPVTADAIQKLLHDACGHVSQVAAKKSQRPSSVARSVHLHDIVDYHIPIELRDGGSFACVSIVLVAKETTEPVLAVHGCFRTEADALSFAERGKIPQLVDSAMLCVVPMYEWVFFDDAAEWCVSLRKSRDRQLGFDALKKQVASHHAHGVAALPEVPHPVPTWVQEKEQATKIHQLVCVHLGLRLPEADIANDDEGYTPKINSVLDQKLDALRDILTAQHARSANMTLSKVQKMQKMSNLIKAKAGLAKDTASTDTDVASTTTAPN